MILIKSNNCTSGLCGHDASLVLGSIYFESRDLAAARDNFQNAFELGGKRAFEAEDHKCLKFLKEIAPDWARFTFSLLRSLRILYYPIATESCQTAAWTPSGFAEIFV